MNNKGFRLLVGIAAVALFGIVSRGLSRPAAAVETAALGAGSDEDEVEIVKAGPRPVDEFHPANAPGASGKRPAPAEPAYGGRIIIHLESMPDGLNRSVENSAVTREMAHIFHESLAHQDWEMWDYKGIAASSWEVEDMLVLNSGAAANYPGKTLRVRVQAPPKEGETETSQREADVVYGKVTRAGADYLVTPISRGALLKAPLTVAGDHVDKLDLGAVYTFIVRDNVYWHPSTLMPDDAKFKALPAEKQAALQKHKLDAHDVHFSWNLYNNPHVDCDEIRFQYVKATHGEVVDDLTWRLFYETQYFDIMGAIGADMCILPRHLYDLSDPDNPNHKTSASEEEQAEFINANPHNQVFVGLGPYRITQRTQTYIECTRFENYFNDEDTGYFDVIRYLLIDSDNAALQALINGEIDFTKRLKTSDYFGEATRGADFSDNFYKGYFYMGGYGFTGWNLYKPVFKDVAVRKALDLSFDFDEYWRTNYKGLANRTTGPFPFNSPAYNHAVKPDPYDPDLALETLEDAGWYDRNGNGIADQDGVELEFEFMMPAGNEASKNWGLKMQESFAVIGVKMNIVEYEWATFIERLTKREFDSGNLAWMPSLESSPEQIWHSKWGKPGVDGSNFVGFSDPDVDRWITEGTRELDKVKRTAIWHKIHERIYDLRPYMFGWNVPRKFAMNKKVRGFQSFALRPGFYPRRWYYAKGTPGTRATLAK